ncbi:coiled-coil domain-containing protein 124-like isoform X2 [Maniola jurtina]|uniref:coiled-coil domain-containing protein 124-like isoform X2 n=1 Tax=Maniola jurtina TaxID=191418 RepID=UPI001E68CF73|nr:coiled-coil domain-containing protein 124-like isoform X2 [Maniola jurtina]
MELLRQVSHTQFLFPAAAVAVVLVCAALVFIFGFHTAEQPQFDKLPLVVDDRKSSNKKRKTKEKTSPNRISNDDAKSKSESAKKSPVKEKKEEKVKDVEKPKPKEKVEVKVAKKEAPAEAKKGKKKAVVDAEKPADFDDGLWQEVPKKSDKKKVKGPEEKDKKESPSKKNKKKVKDADTEVAQPEQKEEAIETIRVLSAEGPEVDEDSARALQAQVEELQRVLKEAELRDQALLGTTDEDDGTENELTEVKDLRSNKKMENKEKQIKKKASEAPTVAKSVKAEEKESPDTSEKQDYKPAGPVFDELGDTWSDAKVSKKGKKKARKE